MEHETKSEPTPAPSPRRTIFMLTGVFALIVVAFLVFRLRERSDREEGPRAGAEKTAGEHKDGHTEGAGHEVALSAESLKAAGIETAEVSRRPGGGILRVTGTVEANQQQMQQATPLVSGRVERVQAVLGQRVGQGAVLAVIASPQIAQMHGKLHEAETKLSLAERELARVMQAENRAAVLAAKARLDEAEATLKRTRRLIELGAGAGKDLIAAETAQQTAKAEYEFQRSIVFNREVQEARAAVETARVDLAHIRDELQALGAPVPAVRGDHVHHTQNTALIAVRAPISGAVIERKVNAGAGVEAGRALFTIANLSTVWVIANVPEAHLGTLRFGSPATIRGPALGAQTLRGKVGYIDPQLNEETRTAGVRVEVRNPGERLKAGMFTEVEFQTGAEGPPELVIPEAAVQRLGERTVVFTPTAEAGHFKVRDVEVGAASDGLRRILSGLDAGERVVTKGSFTLKTQLLKGELGEDHH